MSIKPVFAEEILSGFKKYELRSFIGSIGSGDLVVLYASSPLKAIVGKFVAGRSWTTSFSDVVRLVREGVLEGVTKRDLEFMAGRKRRLLVIEVLNPARFPRPVSLSEVRRHVPGFRPPMSYYKVREGTPLANYLNALLRG